MYRKYLYAILIVILALLYGFLIINWIIIRSNKYLADELIFGQPFHSYKYSVANITSYLPLVFLTILLCLLLIRIDSKMKKWILMILSVMGALLSLVLRNDFTPW